MLSISKQEPKQSESSASSRSLPQKKQHGRLQQQKQKQQKQKQKQNKRHGARNQHRHKFFVKWLVETFDLEKSRAKTAIVATATNICGDTRNLYKHTSSGESKDNNNSNENSSIINDEALSNNNNNGTLVSDDKNEDESCPRQSRNESASSIIGRPQQQMHILDVAGGKGEVSARLTMCHQQQVIMVDPRPADIVDCYERIVLPKIPNKWQRRLEKQREANPDFVKDIVKARFQQMVTTFDEYKIVTDSTYYSDKTTESSSSADSKPPTELQSAVKNATLIVGLHADGATEAIVDAALKYNKPFVVVPCCVFPNFFPMRRILIDDSGDGTSPKLVSVRTHEQFCTYLLRKDPRFVMEELPFEGRNVAIWWDGK
mmetsp:Transcript_24304/g.53191  ORF Transcript_24304/g.53191 Transcript_24304/m.53191 type:complete len:373 (+) Transcript_24304:144-1262(+)